MSDANVLGHVIKLQNRHWVDQDIIENLQKLFEYLDQHSENFSNIEKFKKEVSIRKKLRWGPVHTEKFWQENFMAFNQKDNLDLINELVSIVKDVTSEDKQKAIALFDLGEFARFFPLGRSYLDNLELKGEIIKLMSRQSSSAELKKEAIMCYQKLLMNTWSSQDFKM